MRKIIVSILALCGGVLVSSAAVTTQGWWHLDSGQPIADSSGNGRTFGSAYSTAHTAGGSVGALLVNNGVGGPLDGTGYISTNCVLWGYGTPGTKAQAAMWGIGYNPPAQNYGIEIWILPQDNAIVGGSGGWLFSSGQSGGVALRINNPGGSSGDPSASYIDAFILGTSTSIGNQVPIDTNHWMHLAIVNDGGVITFYTNGVACGGSVSTGATTSAGDAYIGTPSDNQAYYGYLDEARMFTFAAGAFSTTDLLLRPAGPIIIGNPNSVVVWNGGAATFSVTASLDPSLTYQWQRDGANVPGATSPSYYLNSLSLADTGSTFDCIVTSGSLSQTSSTANLSVVANNAANVAAYQDAVHAEASLLGYFTVDGDTGATLTNTKDGTHNGTLQAGATYDGQTNTTFGARSVFINGIGAVQIANNPAFEFAGGNGTVEALVYLSSAPLTPPTIFSEDYDYGGGYISPAVYTIGATADGQYVTYGNDQTPTMQWNVPGGLIGKLSHLAVVFDHLTNVTAYVNGENLGTQQQVSFGSGAGSGFPFWIGSTGSSAVTNNWVGNIDELAIYGSALSQNDVQAHYSKFFYGTNTSAPAIVSQPSSKTLLAGAAPMLLVKASGSLPLNYQWTLNSSPITGATKPLLAIANLTASGTYSLTVANAYGTNSTTPIILTVVPPPSGYATTAMADHPTAFWRLSDSSGTTAADSAGFNDATYSGGFTLGAPAFHGESGTGVGLDGSTGRAIAPLSTVLNPSGPFSIEFWASTPRSWTATADVGFMVPVGSMDRPGRTGGYEFYLDGNYLGYEIHTAVDGSYDQILGDNTIPAPNTWTHVVGVYDGTNIYEYVNGALANPDNTVADQVTPNTVKGFYIGSREDDVRFWQGTIADVAFYNYALSENQISNHYAVSFQAAAVVSNPVGVTNVEFSTVTLTAQVEGLPNTYQWYKNNTPLTDTYNDDGSSHYSQDVTNSTLVINETHPTDSGQYKLVVSNPLGGATTAPATVLITADNNPPVVTGVQALGTPGVYGEFPTPFLVKVMFNKRIDPNTGSLSASYALSGGASVSTVTVRGDLQATSLGTDWRNAFLQTSGLVPGQQYTLTVSGIKDQSQTPNTMVTKAITFKAPQLVQGQLWWDYYYEVTPQSVADLQAFQYYYPSYAPTTNSYLTIFDTDQITGGDLNNNPAFGSVLGDNYGDVVSGYVTPAVSGDYTFFIASDDASELDLSTDSNPINATMIAYEPNCCAGFLEPDAGVTQTSSPQTLQANTPYFIRALHTEGGGGDYVKVAWRISTDSTPATNLTAIASQYLSAYVSLPPAPPKFSGATYSNGQMTITWTGQGTLLESTNLAAPLNTWTPVPGNPPSPFVVTPAGPVKFYQLVQ